MGNTERLPGAEVSGCGTVALNGEVVYNNVLSEGLILFHLVSFLRKSIPLFNCCVAYTGAH